MGKAIMRRIVYLAGVSLLVVLIAGSIALAQQTTVEDTAMQETTVQQTTVMVEETTVAGRGVDEPLAPSGGPGILLPAAALLFGAGVLTYAILQRRSSY